MVDVWTTVTIGGLDTATTDKAVDTLDQVAVDRYCWGLSTGTEILKLGFRPRNSGTEYRGRLAKTGQASDGIGGGFEKKGGIISVYQVAEVILADLNSRFRGHMP